METNVLKESYATVGRVLSIINSKNEKDISIETCIKRYLSEISSRASDKKISRKQLVQLLSMDESILILKQYLRPTENYFNEHEVNLFLIRQFIIHSTALGDKQSASVSRIRVEAKAKQVLGLNKRFQEENTSNVMDLLEEMQQEPIYRKKHPSVALSDNTYIPTLREHLASVYFDNLMYGDYLLSKEIATNKKEKELEHILSQIDYSRNKITTDEFQQIPYQKQILA